MKAAIIRQGTSPRSFSAATKDPHTGIEVNVTGTSSDWPITLGGSGKLIHMSTPVTQLSAKGAIAGKGPVCFDFGAGSFGIEVEHVFASINLNLTADQGQFAWLLSTYTSYAYIDGATSGDSILGVLCMTEGRSANGLDQEISSNAISEGAHEVPDRAGALREGDALGCDAFRLQGSLEQQLHPAAYKIRIK